MPIFFEHKCLKLGDLTKGLMHNSMVFSCGRLSSVFIFETYTGMLVYLVNSMIIFLNTKLPD